jgi:putative transposase
VKRAPYKHLAHVRPFADTPIVYLTAVTFQRRRILNQPAVHEILRGIWTRSAERNGWWVGDYILMPDHVHLFARGSRDADPLRDWVRMWKSVSAREIARVKNVTPPIWQEEYFDRFLRSAENYAEKWRYVETNALSDHLVAQTEDWPYRGRIHTLMY